MKRLVLVLNGKGGVGKSFFAVNLVQFLKDHLIHHQAFDTDNENSTLKRFHADAGFVDLAVSRELDALFEALASTDRVVADGRAASTDLFLDYLEEIDHVGVLKAMDARLTLAIPVNHEADSVDQVQRFTERLQGTVDYVVVRNRAHSSSFELYESLSARKRLLDEWGGKEMDLPRMQDWLVEALNRENLTPTTALKHPAISLLDRQRLLQWRIRFYAQLVSVQSHLFSTGGIGHG